MKQSKKFYRELGKKGGESTAKRGSEYMREIGKKGGDATKTRHGVEHFKKIREIERKKQEK